MACGETCCWSSGSSAPLTPLVGDAPAQPVGAPGTEHADDVAAAKGDDLWGFSSRLPLETIRSGLDSRPYAPSGSGRGVRFFYDGLTTATFGITGSRNRV